jgi:hypothetical protein
VLWIALRYVVDDFSFPFLATLAASALAYVIVMPLERAHAAATS